MGITFNQISSTNRVPGPQAEVDGSRAKTGFVGEPHHTLLIGTRQSAGTAAEGEIKSITGELDGDGFFGSKSMLAQMCRAFKRLNKAAKLSAMALDEDAAGTAAAGAFDFTGTATETSTLIVRVGDLRISLAVTTGDTAADAAAALATAITAKERCFFTAALADTDDCDLTAVHKGLAGNSVTIEVEQDVAGLTIAVTQPTSGATDPDLADAIAALADERYDTIVTGFTADTNMDLLETEVARRWGPTVKQPCMGLAAVRGAHATLVSYGNARNSQFSSVLGAGLSPTPPWIWAAQFAARDALRCDTQPNRPRNGLSLPDCEAPKVTERFDQDERNLLLYDGVSTFKVDSSGNVLMERQITTYQTNANSLADDTYLAIETQRNLADLYLRALQLAGKYGDYLVVPDGTDVDDGVPALSPSGYRGELIAWYAALVRLGRVKDAEGFAEDLVVEINADTLSDIDVEMSPRLVNGLVAIKSKISFRL